MATQARKAKIDRKTTETVSKGELNVDGSGLSKIRTPIGLLNHMLDLFCFHGFFDLTLDVKGDTHIDIHHSNEDIGIILGKAFKEALKEKKGIKRFGSGFAPMENTLGHTVIDISGRGHLRINFNNQASLTQVPKDQEGYSIQDLEHFLESFAKNLGANVIVNINDPLNTADLHTAMETVFKSLGIALDQATTVDSRRKGIPSTKGIID